jgi:restriction modification system DNA specificity domain protein
MREMKPSGVDWIGEMPSSWQVAPLKYGASCSSDLSTYTVDDSKEFLALENVESWTGRLVGLDERPDSVDSSVNVFSETDVLFGKLRPYLAKVCRPDFRGVCSTELLCVSPVSYCRDYLFWLLISKGFIDVINAESYGVKMPRTSWAQMGAHYCPVPPLSEQQAIAGHLDVETAKIDQAMSLLRRELETLEQFKKSVIHEAVTKGLDPTVPMKPSGVEWIGEIPEHWGVKRLKYLCQMNSGTNLTSEEISEAGDYPVYGGNGIRGYYSEFNNDSSCVLVGRQGALCGNVQLGVAPFWATDHAVVVTELSGYWKKYAFYALTAMNLNRLSMAAAQPGLSVEKIICESSPVPPSGEQESVASALESKVVGIEAVLKMKHEQLEILKQLRQSMIFEYVTGKRRVSEVA